VILIPVVVIHLVSHNFNLFEFWNWHGPYFQIHWSLLDFYKWHFHIFLSCFNSNFWGIITIHQITKHQVGSSNAPKWIGRSSWAVSPDDPFFRKTESTNWPVSPIYRPVLGKTVLPGFVNPGCTWVICKHCLCSCAIGVKDSNRTLYIYIFTTNFTQLYFNENLASENWLFHMIVTFCFKYNNIFCSLKANSLTSWQGSQTKAWFVLSNKRLTLVSRKSVSIFKVDLNEYRPSIYSFRLIYDILKL
jgi:hypothetical protein